MNNIRKTLIGFGLAGLLGLTVTARSCSCVPAGHVRVVDFAGSVQKEPLRSGIHFPVNPLAGRPAMDIRTQELKETMKVPTKEGLMATLDLSILYHLEAEGAPEVYQKVGTEYKTVIIEPNVRNTTRDVIASFSCEDLYNANRQKIAEEIQRKLEPVYASRRIVLESVLLRDVTLPEGTTAAIDRKIAAKQAAEQMEYVNQKETLDAERRRIEAKGIADAQKIIAESLTPAYLQWNYTKTMSDLAHSPNTTFIIAPFDQKIVPMLPLQDKAPTNPK